MFHDSTEVSKYADSYIGKFFIGQVVDNNPSDKAIIGQIRVRIAGIWDDIEDNSLPFCVVSSGIMRGASEGVNSFFIPNNNSKVLVIFDSGVETSGIVISQIIDGTTKPSQFTDPGSYGWVDEYKNTFKVNTDGSISIITSTNTSISIDSSGNAKVINGNCNLQVSNSEITLTNAACSVQIEAAQVVINGNLVVNGQISTTVGSTTVNLGTHTHSAGSYSNSAGSVTGNSGIPSV